MKNTNQSKSYSAPKDVFLHLLNITTFYLSIIGFINLYIQYISVIFPDQLNFFYTGITNAVRLFTSILAIAFPAYLLTSWLLGKDLKNNPKKREFKLRKWLLYFTLFTSAITIIIDLITFVYNFLSGEITVRFILKVVIVLLVAAAVFSYYIWDLRRKDKETSKTTKVIAILTSAAVLASIIGGFFIIGTPSVQRERRFDEQRIGDLQMLQSQIINYWTRKEVLPQNLNSLEDSISGFFSPKDPETDLPYGYMVIDSLSFELCAAFKTSNKYSNQIQKGYSVSYPYDAFRQNWDYGPGEKCFQRTIDPELYKINGQPKEPLPARPSD